MTTAALPDKLPVAECKRRDAVIARCMGWTRVRDGGCDTYGCPPHAPDSWKPVPRPSSDDGAAWRALGWLARQPAIDGVGVYTGGDGLVAVYAQPARDGAPRTATEPTLAHATSALFLLLLTDGVLPSEPTP